MGKQIRVGLAVAAVLVVAGLAVFAFAMNACHWDFTNLSTVEYETKTYEISEAFRNISIRADVADITFLPAEDGQCRVVCRETEYQSYQVAVSEGVLTVRERQEKKWYERIGIFTETPSITLYLPDAQVSNLALSASTGRVTVCDVRCKNLTAEIDTGDITLKNVIAEEVLVITADTGDIRFDGCDAWEIFAETDTGDITGTLLSEKVFLAETDTGKIQVPQTTAGGQCRVTTDTGDIKLDIQD